MNAMLKITVGSDSCDTNTISKKKAPFHEKLMIGSQDRVHTVLTRSLKKTVLYKFTVKAESGKTYQPCLKE
jgi:hypothetical protein